MSEKKINKEFSIASWAIDNATTIYVVIVLFFFIGLTAYYGMSRENFPEIKETKIYVSTIYPGNTAEDVERLITDKIEEQVKNVSNVVDIVSTSQEDYSMITVEFDEKITVEQAKVKIKDKIDGVTANEDWPLSNGVKVEPNVFDLNIAESVPILNINITGDFPTLELKEYGEILQDEIELLSEIKEVSLRGAQDKEVEIAVDIYKMTASGVTITDVVQSIKNGNSTISSGNLVAGGQKRTIRLTGEIDNPKELENFVVKNEKGKPVYLKDVAQVFFKEKEKNTYAREFQKKVVMLDVKKRSGKNMIEVIDKIKTILKETQETKLPSRLKITYSNDQSEKTINQVNDLVNNIIFGVILVVGVLLFFLGFKNALFVGFAIPMSMFMSFMILDLMGETLNTMVLFALVMGLGMLVDNGIVVVENVYRLMKEEGMGRIEAAKKGIGEIAFPIIISTATTVAAFIPLGLWPGTMGQFMIYFPKTLSIVLGSSLFVAVFMNSMLTSKFMKITEDKLSVKTGVFITIILVVIGLIAVFFGKMGSSLFGFGTLLLFSAILLWVYKFLLQPMENYFQNVILIWFEKKYQNFLKFALNGAMPYVFLIGTFLLLPIAVILLGKSQPKVEFFPNNKPNQIIVYAEYPQGTDIEKTNAIVKVLEERVYKVIEKYEDNQYNFLVESAVAQVGAGAGNPQTDGGSEADLPHKGKITLTMREYKYRRGADSEELRAAIQTAVQGIPGVKISVEKDQAGPPQGYPVNIEISGSDYDELLKTSDEMKTFLESKKIYGIEQFKVDVNKDKPSLKVSIDREKAGELGVDALMVGYQLRQSLYGEKASVYKKDGEDYDIYVRFNEKSRYNQNDLFNQNIVFRDPATGRISSVPIATVVNTKNQTSFSSIKHQGLTRVVTLYSDILPGTNAVEIVGEAKKELEEFVLSKDVKYKFTGQMEKQEQEMNFLLKALASGLGLIFIILIYQFNSISKPTLIMIAIFLSFIGVLFGLVLSGKPFVIMMTMMGIISLAGIVVNNGVVLLDYTQLLIDRKEHELGTTLNYEQIIDETVKGGRARLRPVLLTAITTILGLLPLAQGINIDFFSLFIELNPNIYVGGDNVIFWGPLAWTVINGLAFATFLTLIIVPVMFVLVARLKLRFKKNPLKKITIDI